MSKTNGNGKHPSPSDSDPNQPLARAREVQASDELINCLHAHGVVGKAVAVLVRNLDAKGWRFDKQAGEMIEFDDGATQVKAGMGLLAYAVGEPIKRAQVLHGAIPTVPVPPSELKKLIDAKLSARINSDNVTTAELVAAKKALVESEADALPTKLTPVEREAEVRRILGVE